ncbi:winged helix-turn-helix transcriptional regulator [Halomonas sp. KAO]|uniref:MarR family winged helix-turn-helix transcriptional regulator n=1 Tax=Halomonas sp. KAO TaxID=2783858 RepID=UPI00189DE0D9|nr:MarR family winged helix-turn-helix transcriptional regulator [Halomonas sp. KAO]MBF7053278.1 winged helix-turn-helix transcriptional regulator [Halomonas sp. KAO]
MRTDEGERLTRLILAVFRTNGRLLAAGDALVAPLGLTSARWQVLGAIELAATPLTAPQIAQRMGISRQGVQKQVNLLLEEGLLEAQPNPGHKRSPFYQPTDRGQQTLAEVDEVQARWANQLAADLPAQDLEAAVRVLHTLADRLDSPP